MTISTGKPVAAERWGKVYSHPAVSTPHPERSTGAEKTKKSRILNSVRSQGECLFTPLNPLSPVHK